MAKRSSKAGGTHRTLLPDYSVSQFEGLNTFIKDLKTLSDGQSPDSLNWLTGRYKDHIELRRGYSLLGQTRRAGTGVTGIRVGTRNDETQVPFYSFSQSLMYYNQSTDDTIEIGSNMLPAAANGENISLMPYKNIAGAFMYATSPNSSMYKIPVANPGSSVDLGPTDYRGNAKADANHMFLWGRNDLLNQKYKSVLYVSVPDQVNLSAYTQKTAQTIGTGDGSSKTFTNSSLPGQSSQVSVFNVEVAGPIATVGGIITNLSKDVQAVVATTVPHGLSVGDCVYLTGVGGMVEINNLITKVVSVSASAFSVDINSTGFTAFTSGGNTEKCEYFIDDQNGNMASNLGGTGTINYATGAYSLVFNTAPIAGQTIYTQFYQEGKSGSIADFTGSGASSYPQFDGGGDIQSVYPFDQVQYVMHMLTAWYLNISTSPGTNLPYRNRLGAVGIRGGMATEDGVVYLDNSIPSQPRVQILTIDNNSATTVITVVPKSLSDTLDLGNFGFSKVAMFRWAEYDIMTCAQSENGIEGTTNAVIFIRNIYSGQWDFLDIPASCFDEFMGTLISGDSLSNNVFTLFSGFTDDGANINNYWKGKLFDLGANGLKKAYRFVMKGLIQQTQEIDLYFSLDSGNFVKFFSVMGNGPYVNIGNPVTVGSNTVGSQIVGGGGDIITAYPFEVEFLLNADEFEYIQPQFIASGLGYVQIDEFTFKDIRLKARRIPVSRTAS